MRSEDVIVRLRARYSLPEWIFLEQVANGTGSRARRWADGLAMNLWPSRGCEIHGLEVKVSRSDWLSELRNPEKADVIASYCDRWWLAVGDERIVKEGELPPAWGLLVPDGDGLRVAAEPTQLEPASVTRPFVAAILKRATQQVTAEAQIKARVDAAVDAARQQWEAQRDAESERRNDWYSSLKATVEAFEAASGIKIAGGWNGPQRVGEALRLYLSNPDAYATRLRGIQQQLQTMADEARAALLQVEGNSPRAGGQ